MSPELDKKLTEEFPEIFRDRNGSVRTSSMPFGFTCGDGWFNIIYFLCKTINHRIKHSKCEPVVATQVKEKFGTLRFYVNGGDDYTDGAIELAEMLSSVTCDKCGSPSSSGPTPKNGWISTRCEEHS